MCHQRCIRIMEEFLRLQNDTDVALFLFDRQDNVTVEFVNNLTLLFFAVLPLEGSQVSFLGNVEKLHHLELITFILIP